MDSARRKRFQLLPVSVATFRRIHLRVDVCVSVRDQWLCSVLIRWDHSHSAIGLIRHQSSNFAKVLNVDVYGYAVRRISVFIAVTPCVVCTSTYVLWSNVLETLKAVCLCMDDFFSLYWTMPQPPHYWAAKVTLDFARLRKAENLFFTQNIFVFVAIWPSLPYWPSDMHRCHEICAEFSVDFHSKFWYCIFSSVIEHVSVSNWMWKRERKIPHNPYGDTSWTCLP